MVDSGTITLDAEKYLELLDRLKEVEAELRNFGKGGFTHGSTTPRNSEKKKNSSQPAMTMDIDVTSIVFKQKKKADGNFELAGSHAKWGWTFGYTQQGDYQTETRELVQVIEQYGSIQVGNRIYTLGGRDNKLLNFKEA